VSARAEATGVCPSCMGSFSLRADGKIPDHETRTRRRCAGFGKPPANVVKKGLEIVPLAFAMMHDSEILAGIPSGVWADAWATRQEERGRSFSGQDIMAAAPKPPPRARAWGKKIAGEIVRLNSERHGKPVSLEDLYQAAVEAGYPHSREHFGYHLGMQAVGHGVSFSDDCSLRHDAIIVPQDEFYY